MKIDIGFGGPKVKMTGPENVCYLQGSNTLLEWLHHFTPFSAYRERKWARQVADIVENDVFILKLAGHSLGGTVATMVAGGLIDRLEIYISLYTYGAKRPKSPFGEVRGYHYAVKGDWVPYLPPWRPALNVAVLDYGKLGPIEAHGPEIYYEQMEKDGVR